MRYSDYKVLEETSRVRLELDVVVFIGQGWQPIGGITAITDPAIGKIRFFQAIALIPKQWRPSEFGENVVNLFNAATPHRP